MFKIHILKESKKENETKQANSDHNRLGRFELAVGTENKYCPTKISAYVHHSMYNTVVTRENRPFYRGSTRDEKPWVATTVRSCFYTGDKHMRDVRLGRGQEHFRCFAPYENNMYLLSRATVSRRIKGRARKNRIVHYTPRALFSRRPSFTRCQMIVVVDGRTGAERRDGTALIFAIIS